MSLWVSLARRYKRTPRWSCQHCAGPGRSELAALDAAADLAALQSAEKKAHSAYLAEAKAISKQRTKAAAPNWRKASRRPCKGLGMQGGQFQVALEACQPSKAAPKKYSFW